MGLRELAGSRRKTLNTCKEIKATTCAHASVCARVCARVYVCVCVHARARPGCLRRASGGPGKRAPAAAVAGGAGTHTKAW